MTAIDLSTMADFQKNKPILLAAFEQAIHKTLVRMGDDIYGLEWFGSHPKRHKKEQTSLLRAA